MTENNVATVKAEIITEMEFIPVKESGSRYNNWKETTKPFNTSSFDAKVGVKVGNSVKELTMFRALQIAKEITNLVSISNIST